MEEITFNELGDSRVAPMTAAEVAASKAVQNASDEYSCVGQCQVCGGFTEFSCAKRPTVLSVLFAVNCATCGYIQRHKLISVGGTMVAAPRVDVKAPPRAKMVAVQIVCIHCNAEKTIQRAITDPVVKHVAHGCSCVNEAEKTLHRVSAA
jgi:hypothetical protein